MVSGKRAKRERRRRPAQQPSSAEPHGVGLEPAVSERDLLPPEILAAAGYSVERAFEARKRHAVDLVAAGVTFVPAKLDEPEVRERVEDLLGHITGTHEIGGDTAGGVVAVDSTGLIIGVVIVGAAKFDRGSAIFVRYVVSDPAWRGRGVGLVLLGVLPQVLGHAPAITLGNCALEQAGFYERAGFNVLQPGAKLPFPLGNAPMMGLSNVDYPCWFFRMW